MPPRKAVNPAQPQALHKHQSPRAAIRTGWARRAATLLLATLVAVLPASVHAARLAFVVGNDSYQALRPLLNASKDARDVAAELSAAGFRIPDKWLLINANRKTMDAALQDFVASIGPGDEVVFYFSGHGVEIDAQAALVPVDLSDPARRPLDGSLRPLSEIDQAKRQVLEESITLNRVASEIAARNVAFSLLIVDACRDNPVLDLLRAAHASNPTRNAGPRPAVGLIADTAADTQVLLFSAAKGQQALDRLSDNDPDRNGVFTRVLLSAMRTPGEGLREMLPRVKSEVRSLAATVRIDGRPHLQEPRSIAAFDAPNFYFRPPVAAATPAVLSVVASAPAPVVPQPSSTQPVNAQVADTTPGAGRKDLERRVARDLEIWLKDLGHSISTIVSAVPSPGKASDIPSPGKASDFDRLSWATRGLTEIAGLSPRKDCDDCPELRVFREGEFLMASSQGVPRSTNSQWPERKARVSSFAVSKPITAHQWQACVVGGGCLNGPSGRAFSRERMDEPKTGVNWLDAQAYVAWLTAKTGKAYRLLSEVERHGIDTLWDGLKREWVQDAWHDDFLTAPTDGSARTQGGDDLRRVVFGDVDSGFPRYVSLGRREGVARDNRISEVGFRVARSP